MMKLAIILKTIFLHIQKDFKMRNGLAYMYYHKSNRIQIYNKSKSYDYNQSFFLYMNYKLDKTLFLDHESIIKIAYHFKFHKGKRSDHGMVCYI